MSPELCILSVVFLPLVWAGIAAFIPAEKKCFHFWTSSFVTFFVFVISALLFKNTSGDAVVYQVDMPWIASMGIRFHLGLDGISAIFIALTALLSMLAIAARWISHSDLTFKSFTIAMLALETAMMGTFAARDLFLFYIFFETTLLPMYFLIGVFGGPRKIYATLKFFIYTMAGSLLMLIALVVLFILHWRLSGTPSMDFADLARTSISPAMQTILFSAFLLAFAVKMPIFPLHTWLPDAHVEAPTGGSVILAGILLKLGGYGIVRVGMPIFPEGLVALAPWLSLLAVIGIVYGALAAWAQWDMKKLIAYSSVSHMGFVALGLASTNQTAVSGAVFQMVAHGLSTSAMFLLVGMIYERRHTRMMGDYGGLVHRMPLYTTLFIVGTLASIGLPGMSGFVGEFLILFGTFQDKVLPYAPWLVGIAVLGIVLGAAYMLMMVEKVFFGKLRHEENKKLTDISWKELATVLPLLIATVVLGIYPKPFLQRIEQSLKKQLLMTSQETKSVSVQARSK